MTSEARRAAGLYVDDSWRTAGSWDRFSDAEAANELRMLDECAAPPQAPPLTLPPHSPLPRPRAGSKKIARERSPVPIRARVKPMWARSAGRAPQQLKDIRFRKKYPGSEETRF